MQQGMQYGQQTGYPQNQPPFAGAPGFGSYAPQQPQSAYPPYGAPPGQQQYPPASSFPTQPLGQQSIPPQSYGQPTPPLWQQQ